MVDNARRQAIRSIGAVVGGGAMLGAPPSIAKSRIAEGLKQRPYDGEPDAPALTPEEQRRLELESKGYRVINDRVQRDARRSRLMQGHDPMDMDLAALKSASPSWKVNIQVRRANDAQTMYQKLSEQWEDLRDKPMEMAEKFIADLIG